MEAQVALGPRVPGTEAHRELVEGLAEAAGRHADLLIRQDFALDFRGGRASCTNVVAVFRAARGAARRGRPVLFVTHFDSRAIADREPDAARRRQPIPGANDGGSGTAVLLSLLEPMRRYADGGDVTVAFVDAEDVGRIDGHEFSTGAELLAARPPDGIPPWGDVVALDMVGGRDMILDVDAHAMDHGESLRLTRELFGLGRDLGYPPFLRDKERRFKYIVSDHYPFLRRGIPSCLLIDIDYPQWHMQEDLPAAMSEESLSVSRGVLSAWLERRMA